MGNTVKELRAIEVVKLFEEWGVTDFEKAMLEAARSGHIEVVKLCMECGVTDFDQAMFEAARSGHIEIVKLCMEWGAIDFELVMEWAVRVGHIKIVKLCRDWLGFDSIHDDLFQYHHKRQFARGIHDDLLPIAWRPDRVLDWCFDEEEKQMVGKLWN